MRSASRDAGPVTSIFFDLVSARAQPGRDRVDGLGAVELGFVFAVGEAQVVCEGDPHVDFS